MKILFVDNSADLEQKWIQPLREKGWGVLRARSIEDADRMMTLHAEALQAIVVSEKFVSFAEKNDLVFVVLIHQWGDKEISTHQNSDHSAIAYIPYQAAAIELMSLFDSSAKIQMQSVPLKATGTDGTFSIALEQYSDVLSQPEASRSGTASLVLESPNVMLGGGNAVAEPEFPEVQELTFSDEPQDNGNGATVILDTSKMSFDLSASDYATSSEDHSGEKLDAGISLVSEVKFDPIPSESSFEDLPKFDDLNLELENEVNTPLPASPISQFTVNPHPTAQLSDVETLKSYLSLREQDVALLTGQLRSSQERMKQLELSLKVEKAKNAELSHMVSKQEQTIKNYNQEKQVELEVMEKQLDDLSDQLKDRTDKTRSLETKLRLTQEEVSKMKERIRVDIRKIRVREKELENQLEILKKDSSALLQARDEKVLELKRKIDLLEFNMELVQEQYSKERTQSEELKARLKEAASVMKQAGGMLEQ